MGRFAEMDAEMAVRLAAADAMESVSGLAEVAPAEAERILAETDLARYAELLADADRSVARRDGADMRSELHMRAREIREQTERLERRLSSSGRDFPAWEREFEAARALGALADSVEAAAADGRWTRRKRG